MFDFEVKHVVLGIDAVVAFETFLCFSVAL